MNKQDIKVIDAINQKGNAERAMLDILEHFEETTGLKVDDISLDKTDVSTIHDSNRIYVRKLRINVSF